MESESLACHYYGKDIGRRMLDVLNSRIQQTGFALNGNSVTQKIFYVGQGMIPNYAELAKNAGTYTVAFCVS